MGKLTGIFLDDERNPEDVTWLDYRANIDWVVVRTMEEFLQTVNSCQSVHSIIISFDHDLQDFDLNGNESTGYDCLKALVEHCMEHDYDLPECVFHTQNPIGRINMQSYYENACKYLS